MQKVDLDKPIPQILESLSIEPGNRRKYNEGSMISAIKTIQERRLLPYEVDNKNNVLRYAVDEWFTQKMRERYQELSPEIFELEREISTKPSTVREYDRRESEWTEKDYSGGSIKLKIPLFATAELGKEAGWTKEFRISDSYSDSQKALLFSRIPTVPPDIRKSGKEALAFAFETYQNALLTDELSDIMITNPEYAPNPSESKLVVLWKPKPSEIHIKMEKVERDPALVLKYNKPYLVSTWSVEDEEPFMSILSACKITNIDNFLNR